MKNFHKQFLAFTFALALGYLGFSDAAQANLRAVAASGASALGFSSITSGTNSTAAMVVGTGGSLTTSGSGTITATAAPISGVTGLATGVATFLGTPSSANLRGALSDETGTGLAYFQGGALGTPSSGTATNLTGTAAGLTAGLVTNGIYTTDTGTVTSTMLAGSIANAKLSNSTMTLAGHSVALGGTQTFGCADLSNGATGCSTATGTSGATIPVLNAANTWSGVQTVTNADLRLLGTSTGYTTLNSGLSGAGNTTLTLPVTAADTIAALATAETWTAAQTFTNADLLLKGSSSGAGTLEAPAAASSYIWTLPAATDTIAGISATQTFTNKTYDTAGTGNSFKINGTSITAIGGNTGTVATTTGTLTSTHCVKIDASGNMIDSGAVCGGSSELVLIATATASTSSTINFTSDISASYSSYKLIGVAIVPSTTSILELKESTNNGVGWLADFAFQTWSIPTLGSSTYTVQANGNGTTAAQIGSSNAGTFNFEADFICPPTSGGGMSWESTYNPAAEAATMIKTFASGDAAVNAIQLLPSTGTLTSGTFYLYGVKNT